MIPCQLTDKSADIETKKPYFFALLIIITAQMGHLKTNNKISLAQSWVKPVYVHFMTEVLEIEECDFISRLTNALVFLF